MKKCHKCGQSEEKFYQNRCHNCYLILRKKLYDRTKPSYRSQKQQYRLTGHVVWIRDLLKKIKRKKVHNIVEPDRDQLKLLAEKLFLKLHTITHCPYTGEQLVIGKNISLDHKIPRSKRPDLAYEYDNLQWVSKTYNRCKSDLTDAEFRKFCRTVLKNGAARIH